MKMDRYFHKGFFKEIFRQLRTAALISGGLLALFTLTSILIRSMTVGGLMYNEIPSASNMSSYFMLFVQVCGILLPLLAFGWMNKRSHSDFYHSIPIPRLAMYFSTVAAVLLWMLIDIIIAAVLLVGSNLIFALPFNYLLFLCVLANVFIAAVTVVAATSLASVMSGTRFVNIVAALVIYFIPWMMIMLFGVAVSICGDSLLVIENVFFLFNPSYGLSVIGSGTANYADPIAMAVLLIYALLLMYIGALMFKKRKSEAAGIPTTNRILQTVLRCAVSLPLLLLAAFVSIASEISSGSVTFDVFIIIIVLISFVVYCMYELISTKSARRMFITMPFYLVCVAIAVVYRFVPGIVAKAELRQEVTDSNIKSYSILSESPMQGRLESVLSSFVDLQGLLGFDVDNKYVRDIVAEIDFSDKRSAGIIAGAYRKTMTGERAYGKMITVKIDRTQGKTIVRNIYLDEVELNILNEIWNENAEYRAAQYAIPEGNAIYYGIAKLDAHETELLGDTFMEELKSLSIEQLEHILSAYDGMQTSSSMYMSYGGDYSFADVLVMVAKGTKNYRIMYPITDLTPNTAKLYVELFLEEADDMKACIDEAASEYEILFGYGKKGYFDMQGAVKIIEEGEAIYYDMHISNYGDPEFFKEVLEILERGTIGVDENLEQYVVIDWIDYFKELGENKYFNSPLVLQLSDEDMSQLAELLKLNSYYEEEKVYVEEIEVF